MRYKVFGKRTGLRVSELALGAGNFGTGWGHGAEPDEARRVFDGYVEAGGNFIDTADGYQFGQSESLLGDFIAGNRDELVLTTKFSGGAAKSPTLAKTGNSRKNMAYSVEQSLKRLKTDRIDLYWVHHSDNVTPMEEIVRGLEDLVRSGKILYAGISNFPAWRISRAALLAELRGWAPIVAVQVEYSLVERTPDREILPMAHALGLGLALWSPLAGGLLTGKYRSGEQGRLQAFGAQSPIVHAEESARESAVLNEVLAIAEETATSATQISIAWLLHKARQFATVMVPIIGPRNRRQLAENLRALSVTLTPEQFARLEKISEVSLGVPHEVNRSTAARMAGGIPELLDVSASPAV
jgi:aryl-alcohol dehydrogenase-like predicted oxidoreductase